MKEKKGNRLDPLHLSLNLIETCQAHNSIQNGVVFSISKSKAG